MVVKELPTDSGQRLDSLFGQFDHAGVRAQENTVRQIVTFATEGSFDCVTTMSALNKGLDFITAGGRPKTLGTIILDGIQSYFQKVAVSRKILIPDPGNIETNIKEIERLRDSVNRKKAIAAARNYSLPPDVDRFIYVVNDLLNTTPHDQLPGRMVTTISGRDKIEHHPNFKEAKAAYTSVIDILDRSARMFPRIDPRNLDRLKTPERILQVAQEASTKQAAGIPDMLTTPYNNVTLQDITTATDSDQRGKMVLRYIAGLPKGDYFWQRFIQQFFFAAPIFLPENASFFDNPDFSEKIFLTQAWIAEKLILPAIDAYTPGQDKDFDQLFSTVITSLDKIALTEFSVMLEITNSRASLLIRLLHPELSLSEATSRVPVDSIAEAEIPDDTPTLKFKIVDQVINEFLARNIDAIRENIEIRFPTIKAMRNILRTFEELVKGDYTQIHTETFLSEIKYYLGENFLEILNQRKTGLEQAAPAIWAHITNNILTSYGPHPEAIHRMRFVQGSLPEIMGFKSISFFIGKNPQKPVEFYIPMKSMGTGFVGKLNSDGQVELSVDLTESFPGLYSLIVPIVIASYHDLLLREDIIRKRKNAGVAELPPDNGSATAKEPAKKERRRAYRGLPRQRVLYDGTQEAPVTTKIISSDDLEGFINEEGRKKGTYSPRKVDMFKRFVEGGRKYDLIVKKLETATGTDRITLLAELEKQRQKLTKPSKEKVANLPAKYQLLKVTDPVTGGERTIETWVIAFSSPKPKPEELASPLIMYEKYYSSGPALSYLDYVKTWIVESEESPVEELPAQPV